MALKIGTTTASLYLGSTPVAAYLGGEQVYSAAATLYFNAAVDNDWAEVGNWWLDDEHTQAAGRLPAAADSVIATAGVLSNSGSAPTVVNFTLNSNGEDQYALQISITVTGEAVFNADAIFVPEGALSPLPQITGNATFNDSAINGGAVTGTATFTGSACNDGGTAGTFVPNPPPSC